MDKIDVEELNKPHTAKVEEKEVVPEVKKEEEAPEVVVVPEPVVEPVKVEEVKKEEKIIEKEPVAEEILPKSVKEEPIVDLQNTLLPNANLSANILLKKRM